MTPTYTLWLGDCLEEMDRIESGSVDAIIADLPYGTTACKWDVILPFEPLWKQYKRVIKKRGAVVLFGSEPFSSLLRTSNLEWYKYDWVWNKVTKGDIMNAKNKPLKQHEIIMVFSSGTTANCSPRKMNYYPQGVTPGTRSNRKNRQEVAYKGLRPSYPEEYKYQGANYPSSIIRLSNADRTDVFHPTQKPVALMEYLVLTYTNEGDLVLDNTFGSCSTGEACLRTGRRFAGIEKDAGYFEIGKARMERVAADLRGELNHLPLFAEAA